MRTQALRAACAYAMISAALAGGCTSRRAAGGLKIGFVLHGLNDFTQVIKQGALAAGRDLGVEVDVIGPAGFVASESIAMFESMVQKRVAGIAVVPQPGAQWVRPIREAVEAGIPIITANVTSAGSAAAAWVGQDERNSGVLLARELRKLLEADGKLDGKIVVGSCAPAEDVLRARYDGFREGMAGTKYQLTDAYDVTTENTRNYGTWENLASANRDMVAAVGLCSLDIPNMAKVKARSGAKWLIAGYDLNVETLDAVKAGTAQVTAGQHPYLQGYLPVRALVEHLREKKPLVQGWIDVGTEVVTKGNVDTVYEREADDAVEARWYSKHMGEAFKDLAASAKPFPWKGKQER